MGGRATVAFSAVTRGDRSAASDYRVALSSERVKEGRREGTRRIEEERGREEERRVKVAEPRKEGSEKGMGGEKEKRRDGDGERSNLKEWKHNSEGGL